MKICSHSGQIAYQYTFHVLFLRTLRPSLFHIYELATTSLPGANSDNPIQQKQIMFDSMESILNKNKEITILSERFYCRGALRMMGNAVEHVEHPTEDELNQAKAFGERLKKEV